MRNFLFGFLGLAILAGFSSPRLSAQDSSAPPAYTVTQSVSVFGPPADQTVYRLGSKALIDQASGSGTHTRTLYDLHAHTSTTWTIGNAAGGCSVANFTGDWGEPSFATPTDLAQQNFKEAGAETVNGSATKIYETTTPQAKVRGWWDPKTQLLVKTVMIPQGASPQVLSEVKQVSLAAPAASVFELPAACAGVKRPLTEAEKLAAEMGGNPGDFADATISAGPSKSCAVAFRIVRGGTLEPLTNGFPVGIDTTVDARHPGNYTMGKHTDGTESFSGGGLHEVTRRSTTGFFTSPIRRRNSTCLPTSPMAATIRR